MSKTFSKKLCCLFDLEGFSNETISNEKEAYEILENFNEETDRYNKELNFNKIFRISSFSDSFIVTLECPSIKDDDKIPEPTYVIPFLRIISLLQLYLFNFSTPLYSKGYITYGTCENNEKIVFGKAIVDCANKEKNVKYPSIEIDKSVYKSYRKAKNFEKLNLIYRLNYAKGPKILNIFSEIENKNDSIIVYNALLKKTYRRDEPKYSFNCLFLLSCFYHNFYDQKYGIDNYENYEHLILIKKYVLNIKN